LPNVEQGQRGKGFQAVGGELCVKLCLKLGEAINIVRWELKELFQGFPVKEDKKTLHQMESLTV